MDALNNLVMTNLLTNLLFLIVGLGYGVTFVLMKGSFGWSVFRLQRCFSL